MQTLSAKAPANERTGTLTSGHKDASPVGCGAALFAYLPTFLELAMKKLVTALLLAATVVSLSGCFPVFIPVHDHHHGYYGGYYRR